MISEWMERIKRSELTISDFFSTYNVPFSKAQYFIYKKLLAAESSDDLTDQRKLGGNRKLSLEAEGFLLGCVVSNPEVTLAWLQKIIQKKFSCEISLSSISRAIKRRSDNQICLPKGRPKLKLEKEVVINPLGGFEIIVAIAYQLGWPQRAADIISNKINELKNSKEFIINAELTDKESRTKSGKFSRKYNQRSDVRIN